MGTTVPPHLPSRPLSLPPSGHLSPQRDLTLSPGEGASLPSRQAQGSLVGAGAHTRSNPAPPFSMRDHLLPRGHAASGGWGWQHLRGTPTGISSADWGFLGGLGDRCPCSDPVTCMNVWGGGILFQVGPSGPWGDCNENGACKDPIQSHPVQDRCPGSVAACRAWESVPSKPTCTQTLGVGPRLDVGPLPTPR